MTEWMRGNELEQRARRRRSRRHHAARRLRGARSPRAAASPSIYGATQISERHRHRYEVNTDYRERLEAARPALLPACRRTACCRRSSRYPDHPWFIGVQFHPELKIAPVRAAPAVRSLHRGGGGAEPAGVSSLPCSARRSVTVKHGQATNHESATKRTRTRLFVVPQSVWLGSREAGGARASNGLQDATRGRRSCPEVDQREGWRRSRRSWSRRTDSRRGYLRSG